MLNLQFYELLIKLEYILISYNLTPNLMIYKLLSLNEKINKYSEWITNGKMSLMG